MDNAALVAVMEGPQYHGHYFGGVRFCIPKDTAVCSGS